MKLAHTAFERAIKRNFSKAILARGEALFKKGHVTDFHELDGYSACSNSCVYEASVMGNRGDG